jgi:glycosyltransferase involved in cell wall biosynthesis
MPDDAAARPSVSVLVTTYNWPEALRVCLESFRHQTSRDFEIVVADDGSGPATRALVERMADGFPVPIRHVWHPDEGFRLAAIRNRALAQAAGDYIVLMDGDCFVLRDFVARHLELREPNMFVSGRRTWLGRRVTARMLAREGAPPGAWPYFFLWAFAGQATGPFELIGLPPKLWFRYRLATRYQRAQTCNLGYWRADCEAVGGYDERYVDHGLEDSDFVVRLLRHGARRKEGAHGSIVLHLNHPRRQRAPASRNAQMFADLMASDRVLAGHLLLPQPAKAA